MRICVGIVISVDWETNTTCVSRMSENHSVLRTYSRSVMSIGVSIDRTLSDYYVTFFFPVCIYLDVLHCNLIDLHLKREIVPFSVENWILCHYDTFSVDVSILYVVVLFYGIKLLRPIRVISNWRLWMMTLTFLGTHTSLPTTYDQLSLLTKISCPSS